MRVARITPHGLQKTTDALIRDVSRDGMGVYVKGPYQKGDVLLVKISVKTEEGEAINESLYGRVAWATRLETEGQYAIGLEFHDMENKNPALYAYIQRLEKLQN
jgi:hypothetical protein